MKYLVILLFLMNFMSCNQEPESSHTEPTHNFTVDRIIILNDKNEIFMGREQNVWGVPFLTFKDRLYVNEGLDSVVDTYGLTITKPELRGYFGFKYEYHPFATRRVFYVARYVSGAPKLPEPIEEYKWMTLHEAIDSSIVDAWKGIYKTI